jgi:hypothetical protein
VRERAPTAAERELTQNVPGARAKKADAPPAEPRKEGSKVGGLAPTPAPPALTSTSAAPPATPSAPTASPPATAPSVSGATESVAKQVTPERRAAAQGLTQVAPGLQARLAVVDRAAAEVTVRDLVARATGLVLSQSAASQADAASTTYVLLVPADRWDELRRGLEGLGTLRVTGQKAEDAGQLLITLRLER